MLSVVAQAALNLEQARSMRSDGRSYREIGRRLGLSSGQLSHIRRALKREKAARTRLRKADPQAQWSALPISQSFLPAGLRKTLVAAGCHTLGDLAARVASPDFAGLETIDGIGPHRARLVNSLLDQYEMRQGPDDIRASVEALFPELQEESS